ncbi:hypothetical protein FEM48_Zijuj03G0157400 [Ziziphus jujuba var. spinosa]|uniref:Uncharacterized protein n=1 Tax=Ziziphus jujuba var. spinosa TaxID=714518 RepID=A0A978VR68_ZIZJJ|nr:hypothetical protein FEM48_Zijuj03G0157400 [Ziziphus jujuba var. spinosa]
MSDNISTFEHLVDEEDFPIEENHLEKVTLSVNNSEKMLILTKKSSLVQEYLREELKRLKGIGEKQASYILELREESPKPFKSAPVD